MGLDAKSISKNLVLYNDDEIISGPFMIVGSKFASVRNLVFDFPELVAIKVFFSNLRFD